VHERKEEEIPAFAGIELNDNESKPLYNESPLIPAKAGILTMRLSFRRRPEY
jgi:hypothetical protein